MSRYAFSWACFWAISVKEFIQMRRDRLTFGMMIGIPIMQLLLFGYAINANPRHLPTAVLVANRGQQGRTLLRAIKNSTYFDFVRELRSEQEANDVLSRGEVLFVVTISEDFHGISCAAIGRSCWSKPTRPIPLPPATPLAR